MSLRLISKITITQQPNKSYPSRRNVYTLDFVEECEIKSSWANLTTTASLKFPRNIYIKTPTGIVNWVGQNAYTPQAGDTQPPILLRGDRIKIELGYYYNPGNGYKTETNEEFNGFITKINPKFPMEIECEDAMWLLKQAQCPNKVFPKKQYNVQSIIKELLVTSSLGSDNPYINDVILPQLKQINVINGVGLSEDVETNVGDFRTVNETIAGVLQRLRKDYKLECFFRKNLETGSWNDLYCSGIVYYPKDYINGGTFKVTAYGFQENITDNGENLIYLRKDDVRLGIKAYSVGKYELTSTNSSGKRKTKSERLEAFVGDTDGDIRTQFFWAESNKKDLDKKNLEELAKQRLNKLKFEGWRGSFESFGLPYVQHGMAASLNDVVKTGTNLEVGQNLKLERSGIYLIKGTTVNFGMNGFRRKIDLHLRIDGQGYDSSVFMNGL